MPYERLERDNPPDGHATPISHIHGHLGREHSRDEWIVLTEHEYHTEYLNPYSWSNIQQLSAFRDTTCLFVGLSMSDPNLRRLLDAARSVGSAKRHYAIMCRTSVEDVSSFVLGGWKSRGAGRPSNADLERVNRRMELAAMVVDANLDHSLNELGVRVIWCSSFEEIPRKIDEIRLYKT